ncbi:hypothetical protein DN824_13185 [Stutzerimonas nosocomialis]|uniref:Uncharacterized protein n=1 Tax=Stutzerimonas nosocomialis TaxID=1056496 RepID=A0A5R9QGR6_9GAMM|nr:hypothetical protein [Stutzerimonas nosocomialis]TLX55123.1 hypothetical protein DN826_11615 [Stutzerimonas nosocomialis]TLX56987.1 hypothetical protein DN824_13185 [Stutzerimonas nosocomialis]TLX64361.1 hypothetical protein DN820_06795 [Stutzerimonas nosocomialis]
MIRIRGRIGDWPVDLSVELEPEDWARLSAEGPVAAPQPQPQPAARPVDALWEAAQQVLRQAGEMEGPQLLAALEALAGNAQAGKRLMVRLRHSDRVRLETGKDAPTFFWVEP